MKYRTKEEQLCWKTEAHPPPKGSYWSSQIGAHTCTPTHMSRDIMESLGWLILGKTWILKLRSKYFSWPQVTIQQESSDLTLLSPFMWLSHLVFPIMDKWHICISQGKERKRSESINPFRHSCDNKSVGGAGMTTGHLKRMTDVSRPSQF